MTVRSAFAERPGTFGLAVPTKPIGSPGMETPHGQHEAFQSLLILRVGGTRFFARHA